MIFFQSNIGSGTYTKIVKLGQTGALPGQTAIFRVQTGVNRLKPCQSLSPPVRTMATILHRGSTGLTPGHTGGLHRARFKDVPEMCRYRPNGIPVVTGLLWASSRFYHGI